MTHASDDEAFVCVDCRVNTLHTDEYYMVQFDLWAQIGMEPHGGMLCIGCVEERLGRQLTPADFLDCPLNNILELQPRSERLTNRLGYDRIAA